MDSSGDELDDAVLELNISDMQRAGPSTETEGLKRPRRRREGSPMEGGEKRHCTDTADLKLCARLNIPMLRNPGMLGSPSPSRSDNRSSSCISGVPGFGMGANAEEED